MEIGKQSKKEKYFSLHSGQPTCLACSILLPQALLEPAQVLLSLPPAQPVSPLGPAGRFPACSACTWAGPVSSPCRRPQPQPSSAAAAPACIPSLAASPGPRPLSLTGGSTLSSSSYTSRSQLELHRAVRLRPVLALACPPSRASPINSDPRAVPPIPAPYLAPPRSKLAKSRRLDPARGAIVAEPFRRSSITVRTS